MVLLSVVTASWLLSFLSGVDAQQAGVCSGQSCYVATLSASTPDAYKMKGGRKPTGGNVSGDNCIKKIYKKLGLDPPEGLRFIEQLMRRNGNVEEFYGQRSDTSTAFAYGESDQLADALTAADAKPIHRRRWIEKARRSRAEQIETKSSEDNLAETKETDSAMACTENTLMFGRGTTEIGVMGSTVGPALSSGLAGSGWTVKGIDYSADLSGIYCLGMTGGMRCVDQINALSKACPKTNIVLSGYSQGAMVARICAAWASEEARKQIKGLALFGDPFNGAEVKGIPKSKVKTWCNVGDGVCRGEFSIGAAHLSYVGASTGAALTWIKNIVKS